VVSQGCENIQPYYIILQPCIEAAAHSVYYHVNLDTNFEDRTGFICGVAKYNEEATVHAQLVCDFILVVTRSDLPISAPSLTHSLNCL